MKPKSRWPLFVLVPLTILVLLVFALDLATPPERSYGFVSADHPIDMWADGKDRWAYFGAESFGPSKSLADKARVELLPLGFTEDSGKRPWYRFVKGDEEVVICDHSEFAVNGSPAGSKLELADRRGAPQNYPCVLVKNGPGTSGFLAGFQVKKLMHGW